MNHLNTDKITTWREYDHGKIMARYGMEHLQGNPEPYFSITGEHRVPGGGGSCGCLHDSIAIAFPELKHLIPWHLCSPSGPMHYTANALYRLDLYLGLEKFSARYLRRAGLPILKTTILLGVCEGDHERFESILAVGRGGGVLEIEGKLKDFAALECREQFKNFLELRLPELQAKFKTTMQEAGVWMDKDNPGTREDPRACQDQIECSNWLEDHGITLTMDHVGDTSLGPGMVNTMYKIKVRRHGHGFTFKFTDSAVHSETGQYPDRRTVLSGLGSDAYLPEDYDEFVREYGYEDTTKTKRLFRDATKHSEKIKFFFTEDEIQELQSLG